MKNYYTGSHPEWQDILGCQRCTVVVAAPLNISRIYPPCQCEEFCNFRGPDGGARAALPHSLARDGDKHDRHFVPVGPMPVRGFGKDIGQRGIFGNDDATSRVLP